MCTILQHLEMKMRFLCCYSIFPLRLTNIKTETQAEKDYKLKFNFSYECFYLFQTPSQQGAMLDNDQEGVSGNNQWVPYSLGRRDVPPDNHMKKVMIDYSANNMFYWFLSSLKTFFFKKYRNKCGRVEWLTLKNQISDAEVIVMTMCKIICHTRFLTVISSLHRVDIHTTLHTSHTTP